MFSAGQWFMIAGVLMVLFGVGLLVLVWHRSRPAPVRVVERLRLHEVTMLPGNALGLGYSVEASRVEQVRQQARRVVPEGRGRPYRTGQRALDATRLDLRRYGGGHRGVRP